MIILQRLRCLALALGWPALTLFAAARFPEGLERWESVTGLAAPGLAIVGALLAAGFSQWRLTNGFLLVAVTLAAGRFANLPTAVSLVPVLALGILPWLREGGLTGLPNRRALDDALKGLPGRWSLSMVDVDHFKKFNDTWGHDVGDQVLRRVAMALQGVGGRGKAYRYGGEEFSVLFPHDDQDRAAAAIEEVREKIAATPFQVRGQRKGPKKRGTQKARGEQRITVSAGLAAADGEAPSRVFKRADQALYKAKKKGRNRLVRAG